MSRAAFNRGRGQVFPALTCKGAGMGERLTDIERLVLSKMKNGEQPSQRFNMAQGVLSGLIRKGLVTRNVNPNGGAMKVGLTTAGARALGLTGTGRKRVVISMGERAND